MTEDQIATQKESLVGRIPKFTTIVTGKTITIGGADLPYTTVTSSPSEVVIEADTNGEKVTITFQIFDDTSFKMTSSATNDMDHLIWNKNPVAQ